MSIRTEKVSSLMKDEIGEFLTREFRDASVGFTTVTEVQMTPDLKLAKIYVSIFGSEEVKQKTLKALEQKKAHVRHIIGSHMRLKFTPTIEFFLDDSIDKMMRIETLLKKIHDEDAPKS